jgi:hypothetical protein
MTCTTRQQNTSGNKQSGFIALTSAIIISVILTTIVFTISFTSFSSRINISGTEFKEKSMSLAEACIDNVILKLQGNEEYTPDISGDLVQIGADYCTVVSINPPLSWPKIVTIQATYPDSGSKRSYSNLEIQVSKPSDEVIIDYIEELDTIP